MILAGDIGGTKTDIAVVDPDQHVIARQHFDSRSYASLDDIVREFLSAHPVDIRRACFGIAGPVHGGTVKATNLPWVVDGAALASTLGIDRVLLINDLEATAHGIAALDGQDQISLQLGAQAASGHAAVIAAGTGLGEAGMFWDGQRHHPYASEGGHATFAPQNDVEFELLQYLGRERGHVSWERVLSGPGLFNIYRFLRDTKRRPEAPTLADELRHGDPPAVISRAGIQGHSELCVAALDLFVSLYGSEAGNLALKTYATGGVYLAGGIAPKILEKLTDGTFVRAFTAKGRMQSLLEAIPVRVVVSDKVNLLGAARRGRASG
jgi:glucokinase